MRMKMPGSMRLGTSSYNSCTVEDLDLPSFRSLHYSQPSSSSPTLTTRSSSPYWPTTWIPASSASDSGADPSTGTEIAGKPAKLAGTVKTSFTYAFKGEEPLRASVTSDSRGGDDGAVGHTRTSISAESRWSAASAASGCAIRNTLLKSRWTSRRTRWAWRK